MPLIWLYSLGERLWGKDWSKITEHIPTRTVMQVSKL